jgi:CubicO group peptidase (beta-lactamase class C family)
MTGDPTTLANWRLHPHSQWSFRHVEKIVACDMIAAGTGVPLQRGQELLLDGITVAHRGEWIAAESALTTTDTDSFLVLHEGKIVCERYLRGEAHDRHILFSVSKSVTGTLAGILVGQGKLDPTALVTRYVPEVAASAYGDCLVRHLLDMTAESGFVEDYLDANGDYARYRSATGWNPPRPEFKGETLHQFLATVRPAQSQHGQFFKYTSPHSDLLGWVLERASGLSFATMMSELLWKPLGADQDALITVDAKGAARTAGGIACTLRDLGRFAELMRLKGLAQGKQVVPEIWIDDILRNGSRDAWKNGAGFLNIFPQGSYRTQWYLSHEATEHFCAIGIHGQWIYVEPARGVVIIKFSSQPLPLDEEMDVLTLNLLKTVAKATAELPDTSLF